MKRLIAALLAALLGVNSGATEEDTGWTVAAGLRSSDTCPEGCGVVYRYRSGFAPSFKRAAYPDRVIISWRYTSADGMPAPAEREAMGQLENLLEPQVGPLSTLVLVSTGDGLREWVYYARSQDDFMGRLNEALQDHPPFPVTIDLWKDPEWAFYKDFKNSLQQ